MNESFLQKAEKMSTFNLTCNDFSHVNYKTEIRYLINKHWFPMESHDNIYNQNINKWSINESVDTLKQHNNEHFENLYSYHLKGVGPGEVMLYYMINNATIGGGNSSGVDISVDGLNYEVKSVQRTTNKKMKGSFVNDFKLGGTTNLHPVIKELQSLTNINKTEIAGSKINNIRNTPEFREVEEVYRQEAAYYFNSHNVIFLDNSKSSTRGSIISIGKVKPENIFIERVTSGTVKPLIKIKE